MGGGGPHPPSLRLVGLSRKGGGAKIRVMYGGRRLALGAGLVRARPRACTVTTLGEVALPLLAATFSLRVARLDVVVQQRPETLPPGIVVTYQPLRDCSSVTAL